MDPYSSPYIILNYSLHNPSLPRTRQQAPLQVAALIRSLPAGEHPKQIIATRKGTLDALQVPHAS